MSSTKHRKVDYSQRGKIAPSSVFSVRLPADLVDDLHSICSRTHIPRNSLIALFLGYCVEHRAEVLGFITCSQSLTEVENG